VFYRPVFTGRVHRLEDQQNRVTIVGIKQALQRAQTLYMVVQDVLVIILGFEVGIDRCRLIAQPNLLTGGNGKVTRSDFH
jgi:hypothetical protein